MTDAAPQPAHPLATHNTDTTGAANVSHRREVFWHNVMREILSGLAAAAASSAGRLSATASGAATGGSPVSELFDGRLAVMTRLGQRIPIADVVPMFACSIRTNPDGSRMSANERMLSNDVQCTIFQIRTPTGEVYTLPVHEIVSFHTLSEQLIKRLEEAAEEAATLGAPIDPKERRPFGFAAYTSLAQAERAEADNDS
ncbi:MAG: hypothetical protein CMJ31_06095 [Phycisphaerae bacterium]|nr:hypothetical protein [Phycisphaerae bacterium]